VNAPTTRTVSFNDFYEQHFLPEHQHPINRGLHLLGTFAALAWVPAWLWLGQPAWLLLFPVVHAGPGLVGHRLFERSAAVGDVRVLRKDFSPLWFIAANHRMAWHWLRGKGQRAG
jgi:hypothetical protein